MLESRRIYLPPLSLIGPGALNDLGEELKSLPYKKALFVTDKILVEIGVAETVLKVVEAALGLRSAAVVEGGFPKKCQLNAKTAAPA